jgi:DivIVA domain-containing protein
MDSTDSAYSALDAIDTVAFKIGVRGYNVDEVDDFLERLSGEVHQLKELVAQQRQQLRQAGERISQLDTRSSDATSAPAPAPAPAAAPRHISVSGAEQVTAMIAMAQQFIEQAQNEAENKARELTTGAQERAREIVAEARSRAEDEVNRLNGLKQRLSEDVETLARQLDSERKRLSASLAEFSRWVESSLQVGGARASVAAAPEPAPRPIKPPPAPAPVSDQGIGQVLNFEAPSHDDRQ